MTRVTATQLKSEIPTVLGRAEFAHERTVISRHGKDVAAVMPMDDVRLFDKLYDLLEDLHLGKLAEAVERHPEDSQLVSLEDLLAEEGLS